MSNIPLDPSGANERVSVIQAAERLGIRKQHLFKVLKRLGIETHRERNSAHAGQAIAYITDDDLRRVQEHLSSQRLDHLGGPEPSSDLAPTDLGWFYLVQLEPVHDPPRFKAGFASNMSERLRHLRCAAPFATVLKKWRCKRLWERTAMDCVTAGCERVHTEVFRADSIQRVKDRCIAFFDLMNGSHDASDG